jgi:hypothetical protein
MKNKKINFFLIFALSLAALAAFNMSINSGKNVISNISLENVEALAQETSVPDCMPTKGFCYVNGIKTNHIAIE